MHGGTRHPYLFFAHDDLPVLREKLSHPWMARKWKHLLAIGDILLTEEAMVPEPSADATEAHYTPAGEAFASRAKLMAFLWLMTGEPRYREVAKRHLLHVCGWKRWYGLGADGRIQPTIDAGIFGSGAAIVYDWLHESLSEEERSLVRRAMIENAARPLCRKYLVDDTREMTGLENNWPAQWFCGVGLVGLVLRDEEEEARVWIKHAEDVFRGIAYFYNDPDGGGQEGPSYAQYMAHNIALFAVALRRKTGVNLLDAPFMKHMARFVLHCSYVRDGETWQVDFDDTPRSDKVPVHDSSAYRKKFGSTICDGAFASFLAGEYGDAQAMWLYGKYLDQLDSTPNIFVDNWWNSPFEVIWFDPRLQPAGPEALPTCAHFRGVDWLVCRSGWKPSDTLFAFKSGRARWWHIQNDKNHFILWANGERLVIDPGIAPYIYSLDTAQKMDQITAYYKGTGHNILLVNGEGQLADPSTSDFRFYGPEAGRAESIEQAGRTLIFLDAGFGFYLKADATRPYYGRLRKWHRHLFSAGLRYLVMFDDVECNGKREIEWTLHTPKGLKLHGDTATLTRDRRELMTVILARERNHVIQKKEGFDEASIWISPEEKVEGDLLDMIPRAEYLSVASRDPVDKAEFLSVLDVHHEGKRSTDFVEAFTGKNVRGMRIGHGGRSALALFRTGAGLMDYGGAFTNAEFAFFDPLSSPRRLLVSEADSLTLQGARYLSSDRPLTLGLEYDDVGFFGRLCTLTTTHLEVRSPGRPSRVTVGGEQVDFGFDPQKETVRFKVRRGVFEVRGAIAP